MRIVLLALLFLTHNTFGQIFSFAEITPLETDIQESSGLLYLDDRVITHMDSGTPNELYEIDESTGDIIRTVVVENATNIDWEDIAANATYIFIGDFGNNSGDRTDLMIYRILIDDYLTTPNDTVSCDTLFFSYEDQVDFTPTTFTTNFDCEAMIASEDSIFLFTKNWGDFETNIYGFPNAPATYIATKIDSLNTEGLVCGADLDTNSNTLMLVGYTIFESFAFQVQWFSHHNFSNGIATRADLTNPNSIQIEGVAFKDYCWYLSSEAHSTGDAYLSEICMNDFGIEEYQDFHFYPNPVLDQLYIESSFTTARIYNLAGTKLIETKQDKIDLSTFNSGFYLLEIEDLDGIIRTYKIAKT